MKNYKIFLSSPKDVWEERELVSKNVVELNLLLNTYFETNLQLIKWETNTHSSVGSSAQQVINKDINDDYNIFLGVMWHRFGTKTDKADSGTEEEFDRAYKKYLKDNNSVEIKFYFSLIPSQSLDEIDPDQYRLVIDFKKKIRSLGVYTFDYKSLNDFESKIRIDLWAHILKLTKPILVIENNIELIKDEYEKRKVDFELASKELKKSNDSIVRLIDKMKEKTLEGFNNLISETKITGINDIGLVLQNYLEKVIEILSQTNNETKKLISEYSNNFVTFVKEYTNYLFIINKLPTPERKNVLNINLSYVRVSKESFIKDLDGLINFLPTLAPKENYSESYNTTINSMRESLNILTDEFKFFINLFEDLESKINKMVEE